MYTKDSVGRIVEFATQGEACAVFTNLDELTVTVLDQILYLEEIQS